MATRHTVLVVQCDAMEHAQIKQKLFLNEFIPFRLMIPNKLTEGQPTALMNIKRCQILFGHNLFVRSNVSSNTTERNLGEVEAVQNFACRIVSETKKYDHMTPVLKILNWLASERLNIVGPS